MSDDTISAEELARWTAWTEGRDTRPLRSDEIARLIHAYEVATARVAELECSLGFSFQTEVRQLREQLAARNTEVAARDAEIAALRDHIAVLLRKYGVHLSSCRTHYREVGMPSLATDCDCGLQSIIDGLHREAAVAARDGSR